MPSERTRTYLDELEDRFKKRAEFYASLEEQLKDKKNDYKNNKADKMHVLHSQPNTGRRDK